MSARLTYDYTEYQALFIKYGNGLDDRQRLVLKSRWGADGPRMTLQQVGSIIGVGKERCRAIEARALRQLKSMEKRALQGLKPAFIERRSEHREARRKPPFNR